MFLFPNVRRVYCCIIYLNSVFGSLQVFGEIAEGLDTLTRINEAYVDEKGRPFKNIRLILLSFFIYYFVDVVTMYHASEIKFS